MSNEVKRGAREDKRIQLEKRVAAAEKAAENEMCRELYNITQSIAGGRRKKKKRLPRTETGERLQRRVEHFNEILNRDDQRNPAEEDERVESEEIKEIDLG